jgi:hypothetical protein
MSFCKDVNAASGIPVARENSRNALNPNRTGKRLLFVSMYSIIKVKKWGRFRPR